MNKRCSRCKINKPLSEYNWKIKNVKRAFYCRDCSRKYIREHYIKNQKYYMDKAHARNKVIKEKAFVYISSYFLKHPCIDCGETDILVLEFDHRDKSTKEKNISSIIRNYGSIDQLVKEIAKCDVRCANCHRRRHEKENNGWRLRFAPVA